MLLSDSDVIHTCNVNREILNFEGTKDSQGRMALLIISLDDDGNHYLHKMIISQ